MTSTPASDGTEGGRELRLAWLTDVHANFLTPPQRRAFAESIAREQPDALLLTGDFSEAPLLEAHLGELAARVGVPVYFVLGNHDYYHAGVGAVRRLATRLSASDARLIWLPAAGVITLATGNALIGVDGFADARHGDWERSGVELNDFRYVEELSGLDPASRTARLRDFGDEEAATLALVLARALEQHARVIVLTHVPPFREVCEAGPEAISEECLPYFTCRAVGDVLRANAERHPTRDILVLCGHTHTACRARILPNLEIRTGGAIYGLPTVQELLIARPLDTGPGRADRRT